MAHHYLLFSNDKFLNYVLNKGTVKKLGIHETDAGGVNIDYTIQKAIRILGSVKPLPVKLSEGVGYTPNPAPEETTHWVCGINSMTVEQDDLIKPLAQLEGKNWRHVKFTTGQMRRLETSGEFPSLT